MCKGEREERRGGGVQTIIKRPKVFKRTFFSFISTNKQKKPLAEKKKKKKKTYSTKFSEHTNALQSLFFCLLIFSIISPHSQTLFLFKTDQTNLLWWGYDMCLWSFYLRVYPSPLSCAYSLPAGNSYCNLQGSIFFLKVAKQKPLSIT